MRRWRTWRARANLRALEEAKRSFDRPATVTDVRQLAVEVTGRQPIYPGIGITLDPSQVAFAIMRWSGRSQLGTWARGKDGSSRLTVFELNEDELEMVILVATKELWRRARAKEEADGAQADPLEG